MSEKVDPALICSAGWLQPVALGVDQGLDGGVEDVDRVLGAADEVLEDLVEGKHPDLATPDREGNPPLSLGTK